MENNEKLIIELIKYLDENKEKINKNEFNFMEVKNSLSINEKKLILMTQINKSYYFYLSDLLGVDETYANNIYGYTSQIHNLITELEESNFSIFNVKYSEKYNYFNQYKKNLTYDQKKLIIEYFVNSEYFLKISRSIGFPIEEARKIMMESVIRSENNEVLELNLKNINLYIHIEQSIWNKYKTLIKSINSKEIMDDVIAGKEYTGNLTKERIRQIQSKCSSLIMEAFLENENDKKLLMQFIKENKEIWNTSFGKKVFFKKIFNYLDEELNKENNKILCEENIIRDRYFWKIDKSQLVKTSDLSNKLIFEDKIHFYFANDGTSKLLAKYSIPLEKKWNRVFGKDFFIKIYSSILGMELETETQIRAFFSLLYNHNLVFSSNKTNTYVANGFSIDEMKEISVDLNNKLSLLFHDPLIIFVDISVFIDDISRSNKIFITDGGHLYQMYKKSVKIRKYMTIRQPYIYKYYAKKDEISSNDYFIAQLWIYGNKFNFELSPIKIFEKYFLNKKFNGMMNKHVISSINVNMNTKWNDIENSYKNINEILKKEIENDFKEIFRRE